LEQFDSRVLLITSLLAVCFPEGCTVKKQWPASHEPWKQTTGSAVGDTATSATTHDTLAHSQPHQGITSDSVSTRHRNRSKSTIRYENSTITPGRLPLLKEKNDSRKSEPVSVAALIALGVSVRYPIFLLLIGPVALVLGIISLARHKKNPGKYKNKGFAILVIYAIPVLAILFLFLGFSGP
jgi:hypothetical protein